MHAECTVKRESFTQHISVLKRTETARKVSDGSTVRRNEGLLITRNKTPSNCEGNNQQKKNSSIKKQTKYPKMIKQVIGFDDKQPFDMPNKKSVSKDIQTQINEDEYPKPVKKNFDEIIDQFQRALQCSNNNEMQNVNSDNITTRDEAAENKSNHVDYNTATEDNIVKEEKFSESSVVSSNADDGAILWSAESNYSNNIKDENTTTYEETDLPIEEQMDVDESKNVDTFINFNDSSDEATTPKKSKQFTFTDSDLPDSDEIREILMTYPQPPPSPSEYSDMSEDFDFFFNSESCSEDESEQPICRRRHKPENTKVDFNKMFEVLPLRVLTRKRKQPDKYGIEDNELISTTLKPRYLTIQEDQISADIIIENMRRLKKMRKRHTDKHSQNQKSVKEEKKEHSYREKAVNKKSNQRKTLKVKIVNTKRRNVKSKKKLNSRKRADLKRKNTKENSLNSKSPAETTSRTTRNTKNKNHVEKTQTNRIILRNRNKKQCKPTNKNELAGLTENTGTRSKRQPKAIDKSEDATAPISIQKRILRQKPQSSSIDLPKSLKRSLVDKSNVSNPKRMRLRNTNNNQEINIKTSKANKEIQLDRRVPYVNLVRYQPTQKQSKVLDSNSIVLKMRTRSQSARRSVHTKQGRKT